MFSSIRGEHAPQHQGGQGRWGGGDTCPRGPPPAASEGLCPELLRAENYLSMHKSCHAFCAPLVQSAWFTPCSICSAEGDQSLAPIEAYTDHPSRAAAHDAADSCSSTAAAAEPVTGIPLSVSFQLRSADGLQTPFTNYVRGYSGLLDYIWFEPSRLKVERAIPLPSLEEVQGYLPSQRFPSDHLSVRPFCCCRQCRPRSLSGTTRSESCGQTKSFPFGSSWYKKEGGRGVCCYLSLNRVAKPLQSHATPFSSREYFAES